jgi:putative nucleotidyltransferase with HDIG domain
MSDQMQGLVQIKNDLMVTVSKGFFVDGMILAVPVYLKMKDDNYLIIGKRGEKANFTNLHSFKNPQSLVFVKKEDHSKLIHHMTDVTDKILSAPQVSGELKTRFILGLTESAINSFDGKGFANVGQLQKVSGFLVKLNESVSNFNDVLTILSDMSDEEAKHSTATAMIAVMLSEEMQMNHKAAQEKLALGCLLHDVGLNFLPKSLLSKPKHQWTNEENELYETHPLKGVEMLRDLKDISNDVLLIVAEHHENAIGTGYPKKLRDIKISPLGKIASLADCFSDLLFARVDQSKNFNSDEAIKYIEDILGQPYNKQTFTALKNIINKKFMQDKANKAA